MMIRSMGLLYEKGLKNYFSPLESTIKMGMEELYKSQSKLQCSFSCESWFTLWNLNAKQVESTKVHTETCKFKFTNLVINNLSTTTVSVYPKQLNARSWRSILQISTTSLLKYRVIDRISGLWFLSTCNCAGTSEGIFSLLIFLSCQWLAWLPHHYGITELSVIWKTKARKCEECKCKARIHVNLHSWETCIF